MSDDAARRFTDRPNRFGINISWTPIKYSDGLYLHEQWEGSEGFILIGPVPPEIEIGDLINERRRMIQSMAYSQLQRTIANMSALENFEWDGMMPPVVADQAGIKSAPPQETAPKTGAPVAEGGAEPRDSPQGEN